MYYIRWRRFGYLARALCYSTGGFLAFGPKCLIFVSYVQWGHWRNRQLEAVKGGLVKIYPSWASRFHIDCFITPSYMFIFGDTRQLSELKEITEKGHGSI
jgi:hypothetical protein